MGLKQATGYAGGHDSINNLDPLGLKCYKSWKADWEEWGDPFVIKNTIEICILPPPYPDIPLPPMPGSQKPKTKLPKLPFCLAKVWIYKNTYQRYALIPSYRELWYDDCTGKLISDSGWERDTVVDIWAVLIKEEIFYDLKIKFNP